MELKMLSVENLPFTLTVDQISELMGVSKPIAFRMVNRKGFPMIREGRRIIIPRDKFIEWINAKSDCT